MARLGISLTVFAGLLVSGTVANAEDVDLLIVAGQSNAVGFNAKPGDLPPDPHDRKILFWWRCGDPPPDTHDSSSGGKWSHLQPQSLGKPKRPRSGRQYGNFAQPDGGFGPEIGLARTIFAAEKKKLAVIKVAFSGTGIHRDWNHRDKGEGGACYRAMISETRRAIAAARMQGITLRPRAFAWIQGESDANTKDAPRYAERLEAMLTAIRRDLKKPNPIALTAINTRFGGGRNRFVPMIVAQQKQVAAQDPRCLYVDTASATIANNAHYDSKGTLLVGRLFADRLLRLEAELRPQQRQITIVTLGDSITKGVRAGVKTEQTFASLLQSQFKSADVSARVVNVGIGGERTDQALKRLHRIIALRPDIVTVMYGTNDSYVDRGKKTSRISLASYRKNLERIVVELLRHGIQPVLMTEPRWSDDAEGNGLGEHPNVRLESYMSACRDVAEKRNVFLVDNFAAWTAARKKGTKLRDWTTDGCHPNAIGHRKIVAEMLPMVRTAIGPALKTRTRMLKGGKVRVVCFGDSVTGVYYHTGSRRAYTDMLQIALHRVSPQADIETINAGISGHTTVNALARIDRDVLRHKPDLVTVMFGLNDMTRVPLETYRNNLKEIVRKCRAAGAEVVLATPNNVVNTASRPTKKLMAYCEVVRSVGRELNVSVCDVYREFDAIRTHGPVGWRLMMSDSIHPNMDGHKAMATALTQTITGARVALDNVHPPSAFLVRTLNQLRKKKPITVLAMPPFDKLIGSAIREILPGADVKIVSWNVDKLSVADIERDAKSRVRKLKPDLVLIAVPRTADAKTDEAFAKSYAWIMNSSLNFGPPTWDCVVVHPAVFSPNAKVSKRDALIRRLVRAQDLPLLERTEDGVTGPAKILSKWLRQQIEVQKD